MPLGIGKKDWKEIARWEAKWARKCYKKSWARRKRRFIHQTVRDEYKIHLATSLFFKR